MASREAVEKEQKAFAARNQANHQRENPTVSRLNRMIDQGQAKQESAGNGTQEGFTTGATRSTSDNKVDYEGHINPEVLAIFGDYMHRHRVQRNGQLRASDNWQQGIPIYRYVKSLVRHQVEFWRMWRGTPVRNPDNNLEFTLNDVLCALMFNVMGLLLELNRDGRSGGLSNFVARNEREILERSDANVDTFTKQVSVPDATGYSGVGAETPKAPAPVDMFRCPQDGERNCCNDVAPENRGVMCRGMAERRGAKQTAEMWIHQEARRANRL